jgi:hypothetical protein
MHEPQDPYVPTPTTPEPPIDPTGSVTVATDAEVDAGIRHVQACVPLATRHAVARAALRAGVRLLVAQPMRVVELLREGRGKHATPDAGKDEPR